MAHDDEKLTDALVIGTPDECVEKLRPFAEVLSALPEPAVGPPGLPAHLPRCARRGERRVAAAVRHRGGPAPRELAVAAKDRAR